MQAPRSKASAKERKSDPTSLWMSATRLHTSARSEPPFSDYPDSPDMKTLSSAEKAQLPYTLLLDPETGRAAAYNSTNQRITDTASKALIDYALSHVKQDLEFDVTGHAATPLRRPPPAWATPEVQARMRLIWINRPHNDASAEEWQELPAR